MEGQDNLDRYYAQIQTNNGPIKGECANRKPKKITTIYEKVNELKQQNEKDIFISFYDPKTRESTDFTNINELESIENIDQIFKERIKGALIIKNDHMYYDFTIDKPFK